MLNCRYDLHLIRFLTLWQLQKFCDIEKSRDDVLDGFCVNPKDSIILQVVSISVFYRDLGFSTASQPIYGVWLCRYNRLVRIQVCMKHIQNFVASCEKWIA